MPEQTAAGPARMPRYRLDTGMGRLTPAESAARGKAARAGRDNGFPAGQRREIVTATAASYRQAMRGFAAMATLEVWYAHRDSMQEVAKLTETVPGGRGSAPTRRCWCRSPS